MKSPHPAPARMDETTNHADDIRVTRITISQPSDREPIEQYGCQEGTNRSASLTRHRSIPTMCSNFADPTSHNFSAPRRIWGVGPRIQRLSSPFVTEPLRWVRSNGSYPPGFECVDWHLQCPGSTGDNKTESADWDATTRIAALQLHLSPWFVSRSDGRLWLGAAFEFWVDKEWPGVGQLRLHCKPPPPPHPTQHTHNFVSLRIALIIPISVYYYSELQSAI